MQGNEAGRAPAEDEPAISEAWRRQPHPGRGGIPGPARVPRHRPARLVCRRVLGLTGRGRRRSPAQDNGIENCITRRLGDKPYLVIDLGDGIPVGYVGEDWAAEQTLKAVYLSEQAEVYHQGWQQEGSLRFADLDPLIACELLGQLTRLVD